MKAAKFIGKFNLIGKKYSMLTPGSAEIHKQFRTSLLKFPFMIKHHEVKNQKGKIISKYIQFPDEKIMEFLLGIFPN